MPRKLRTKKILCFRGQLHSLKYKHSGIVFQCVHSTETGLTLTKYIALASMSTLQPSTVQIVRYSEPAPCRTYREYYLPHSQPCRSCFGQLADFIGKNASRLLFYPFTEYSLFASKTSRDTAIYQFVTSVAWLGRSSRIGKVITHLFDYDNTVKK